MVKKSLTNATYVKYGKVGEDFFAESAGVDVVSKVDVEMNLDLLFFSEALAARQAHALLLVAAARGKGDVAVGRVGRSGLDSLGHVSTSQVTQQGGLSVELFVAKTASQLGGNLGKKMMRTQMNYYTS